MPRKEMTPEAVKELLALHKAGWTLRPLAKHFNIDHKAVWQWVRKEKLGQSLIPYKRIGNVDKITPTSTITRKDVLLPPEVINRGLNYKDYLEILAKRTGKLIRSFVPFRGNYKDKE